MARLSSSDPLEKFRFKVEVLLTAASTVGPPTTSVFLRAGFREVQMPKRSTNKILYRDSLSPEIHMISPGLSSTEDITLTRGLIADESAGFYAWASQSHTGFDTTSAFNPNSNPTAPWGSENNALGYKDNMRKDVKITMYTRTGAVAREWMVYNAFVVNFVAGSDLNAGEDSDKAVESITIAYEDFVEVTPDSTDPVPLTATVVEKLV